jgi:hypothetical protein
MVITGIRNGDAEFSLRSIHSIVEFEDSERHI